MARVPDDGFESLLIGSSPLMQAVLSEIKQLAAVPWPLRIEGPSGTGKRLAAQMLHALSSRSGQAFVRCFLNMIPDGREHAELLGWVKGAFTGAFSDHAGDFEAAHGGSIFLDEIAGATPAVQGALLQLVDEHTVRRIGEHRVRHVDVRIISATNVPLREEVAAGRFREDLYFRLGKDVLRMPSLVSHREDIPELVAKILPLKAREAGIAVRDLSPSELERLMAYEWPGNVRELEGFLESFVTWGRFRDDLTPTAVPAGWRRRLDDTLARYDGNKTAAARALGISRRAVHYELKRRRRSGR